MFFHRDFLFAHVPKTGGWTVRRILAHLGFENHNGHSFSRYGFLAQHATLHEISKEVELPPLVFASVREPCEWYRSYFHYNVRADGSMGVHIARLMRGRPFELKRALHAFLFDIPHVRTPFQMLGMKELMPPKLLMEREVGPYTWLVHHQLGEVPHAERCRGGLRLIDTRSLRVGLFEVLEPWLNAGHHEAAALVVDDNCNVDLVATGKRLLPYQRALEQDFDAEMIEWVQVRDRQIHDLMGYAGIGSSARAPVIITS